MAKKNKGAAKEWRQHEEELLRIEEEADVLWYAANKRDTNYPSPSAFAFMPEVASKIREAYSCLEEAYNIYERMEEK